MAGMEKGESVISSLRLMRNALFAASLSTCLVDLLTAWFSRLGRRDQGLRICHTRVCRQFDINQWQIVRKQLGLAGVGDRSGWPRIASSTIICTQIIHVHMLYLQWHAVSAIK